MITDSMVFLTPSLKLKQRCRKDRFDSDYVSRLVREVGRGCVPTNF